MSQEIVTNQNNGNWEAESFRVTTFFPQEADVSGMESWWKTVVGNEHEEAISRPGLGQLQHTGTLEGKRLVLGVQPGRVDWSLLDAFQPPDEIPERLLSVGPFPDVLESFGKVAHKWLDVCPSVARLAFGAVLIQSVDDLISGYRLVSRYLPSVKIDPEGSSDFFYQINRPRNYTSNIPDLRINRLTKWSVMRSGMIQVIVGAQGASSIGSGPQRLAVRLELDINTSADYSSELPGDKLHDIFVELINAGKEIAELGDIP